MLSLLSSRRAAQESSVPGSVPSAVPASPGAGTAELQDNAGMLKPDGVFNLELLYYCSTMGLFWS